MKTGPYPVIFLVILFFVSSCSTEPFSVQSPDGKIRVVLKAAPGEESGQKPEVEAGEEPGLPAGGQREAEGEDGGQVYYKVRCKGQEIIGPSLLGLEFRDMPDLATDLRILGKRKRQVDETWERVWGRNKSVRNHYNELTTVLKDVSDGRILEIVIRAYNDGIALRYYLPAQESIREFQLTGDLTRFDLKANRRVWAAHYGSFRSHQESEFNEMYLDDQRMKDITGLPLLVEGSEGVWMVITEANLTDWAGMYVRGTENEDFTLETVLSPWPDDTELLVKSRAPRFSPWRVIMIGDSPGDFLESDLIANLNEPNALEDVSWIKPGKSAWDWWWCNRYDPDVDFEMGPNTATMKHFIDLAAEMGWQYQLVDWQWYGPPFTEDTWEPHPTSDITTMAPGIDIPELVRYGADRGVKILLWLEWNHADRQMDEAFPIYEKWGVAGVKVDFMARDDQYVVNFYHRLVKKAAEHHLVVDFHGAYKPTGISRTWPNLLTREGVMGNEYVKWSNRITPEHKVTIPFTRGMLGEMDFTPGAFVNVTSEQFKVETEAPSPMTIGTRCGELAMLVVYESPLQVLCDAPYNYRTSPAGTDFLRIVPTTWDQTRVINAAVGDYITVCRRSGAEWFIGSMTGKEGRTLNIPLDFLGDGSFEAHIWSDSEDADVQPTSLVKETRSVSRESVIEAVMAPAGGHVVHIRPLK
jgi:alpha-glucosidase